jgi:hypothetical protein
MTSPPGTQGEDDEHHVTRSDDLTPPDWWDQISPPPLGVDDVDVDDWLDFGDAGPLWAGSIWRCTVHAVERTDGTYSIKFDALWNVEAIKGALAIRPNDLDELREALGIARIIDAFFGDEL